MPKWQKICNNKQNNPKMGFVFFMSLMEEWQGLLENVDAFQALKPSELVDISEENFEKIHNIVVEPDYSDPELCSFSGFKVN